jgi:Vacuolar sorting protein 9 (VPS9) domain
MDPLESVSEELLNDNNVDVSSYVDLVDKEGVAASVVHRSHDAMAPVVNSTLDDDSEPMNALSPDAIGTASAVSTMLFDDASKNDSLDVTDDSFMASAVLYAASEAKTDENTVNIERSAEQPSTTNENPSSHLATLILPPVQFPSTSVTAARKEQLLLEARLDRLHWIQQVPLPYQYVSHSECSTVQASNAEVQEFLKLSHVSYHLPSVMPVLQHLYGKEVPLQERMDALLGSSFKDYDTSKRHLLTGDQIYLHELNRISDNDVEAKSVLVAYHALMQLLPDPTLSVTVQGIRNFVRALTMSLGHEVQTTNASSTAKFHAYLQSIMEMFQHHTLYQKQFLPEVEAKHLLRNMDALSLLRRSLESFVFGHCVTYWDQLINTPEIVVQEANFQEKLSLLQFVTPVHLDIHCFNTSTDPNHMESIRVLLSKAISALQTMDAYYSAYEKLQRILLVYKEINTALTEALSQANSSVVEKLPSADDILPAFILIILYAQPKRLYYNLQFIEQLALPEYLRGEAGYAYTNLYGAYQFLQDLDLTQEPLSLSISPEALQEALGTYKRNAEQQYQALNPPAISATIDTYDPMSPEDWDQTTSTVIAAPTPLDIRRARLCGEVVNLDWAVKWQETQSSTVPVVSSPVHHRKNSSRSAIETAEDGLPAGFRRNYNFLTVRSPDDIRYSDISLLLKEYHMLVRTTETLLSERAMKVSADRKAQMRAREQRFVTSAQSFDTATDLL